MSVRPLLVALLGAIACGCGDPGSTVRTRAASDLRCSDANLTVHAPPQADSLFENPYPFVVEGCGEIGRYVVLHCHGLAGCTVVDAQIVSRTVRRQASFDLQCGEPEIAVQPLGRDALGARGCGRQASYSLVDCDSRAPDVSGSCRVVQNVTPGASTR